MDRMEEYEKSWQGTAKTKGPWGLFWRGLGLLIVLGIILSVVGGVMGWFGEAAQVAKEEFGPRALLTKYEWFKDAAAQLDNKQATLAKYDGKIKSMEEDYEGVHRRDWDRVDKQTHSQWKSEVDGIAGGYNKLAAEYNSAMAQFHKSLMNVGDPPAGADQIRALPQEFKPYIAE